jgi:leucyl-tRNA synthetase
VIEDGSAAQAGRIEKMSKSKKNVVDPDDIVDQYGADAVRWFMLSDSPPERDLEWSESGIEGCWRFIQRLWRLVGQVASEGQQDTADTDTGVTDKALTRKIHQSVAGIGADIEALSFNKAIAKIYELTAAIEKSAPSPARDDAIRTIILLSAPMVPHLAEEAWSRLNLQGLIANAPWPVADPAMLTEDEVTIVLQIQGKIKDRILVAKDAANADVEQMALSNSAIIAAMAGAPAKKIIVVPNRLVNIVL